jgi:hypothetical protein
MKTKNINIYKELLNNLKFDELYNEMIEMSYREMSDIIQQLAYEPAIGDGNLLIYSFLTMMIEKSDSRELQLLTSAVMGITLNFMNNAERIGLYHGLRALSIDPDNVDTMEYLLYFHQIPEKLLDDALASRFAQRILEKNPDSLAAKLSLR